MAKIAKNPSATDKLFKSRSNAAYPNDDSFDGKDKAGPRAQHGMLEVDRNVDPDNDGGYRKPLRDASGKA